MGARGPRPVVLDAGALIALDRADRRLVRLLEFADEVHVPAGALAQAWRAPARQVRLVRAVSSDSVEIHPLTERDARAAGALCGATGTSDVIDASVVLVARRTGGVTVTSDSGDLRRIDPQLALIAC